MSEVTINGLIEGGKATGGPPFGPALGPLGMAKRFREENRDFTLIGVRTVRPYSKDEIEIVVDAKAVSKV